MKRYMVDIADIDTYDVRLEDVVDQSGVVTFVYVGDHDAEIARLRDALALCAEGEAELLADNNTLREMVAGLSETCNAHIDEIASLREKAIAYDLDQAGIMQREAEAVELVEARAEIARLREELYRVAPFLALHGFDGYSIDKTEAER